MQIFQNSSPILFRNNTFLDNKMLKNENQEEKTQSNISFKNNSSVLSGQESESPFCPIDEDSNNFFWHDLNSFSEESTPLTINLNEKSLNDKNFSLINQSNFIDENISIEKIEKSFSLSQNKDIINESNENELEFFALCTHRLNEDAEKMSGFSGDSFISFDNPKNQDYIFLENDFNNNNLMIDEGKNDSFDNNIKKPIEEIKEKLNISKNSENFDKKKEKINFLVSKKDNNNLMNIENSNNNDNIKNNDEKIKRNYFKNEYIGKKREIEKKIKDPGQIAKNKKMNNLHEINKVTIISPKAFKCECGKIFSTEENQRLHYINIHLHEKPYNCSYCGEGFSHRNGKIYHERVYHTFTFPYPCNECNSAFASKSAMIYHKKSKHKKANTIINI